MDYIARKITRNKWDTDNKTSNKIKADALGDIRTTLNTLSVWECESSREDLAEIALALAASFERLDKVDIIYVPKGKLENFEMKRTLGETPVEGLRSRHIDIIVPDIYSLCQVAEIFAEVYRAGQVVRFTEKQVKNIIQTAIDNHRLSKSDLNEKLGKEF